MLFIKKWIIMKTIHQLKSYLKKIVNQMQFYKKRKLNLSKSSKNK